MKVYEENLELRRNANTPAEKLATIPRYEQQKLLSLIADTYDSLLARMYCKTRFMIINTNILHMLTLCLRGKNRVLDVGCGFGLFGCYFAALYPEISYRGYDMNPRRIAMAKTVALRLGLKNATFHCGDARELSIDDQFDAIMMIDLMHHIDDDSKQNLIKTCAEHLAADGNLVIKDVATQPFLKILFTWALDVLVTRGFEMWYWNEGKFYGLLSRYFANVESFRITHWLPYPHILYLCENSSKIESNTIFNHTED